MNSLRRGLTATLLTGIVAAMLPAARAQAQPETIELSGIVRDFRRSHPDFDVIPIGGPGHYAGNVAQELGTANRPAFVGGGFSVANQWMTGSLEPIAPHMYRATGTPGVIMVADTPDVDGNATFDTWDSSLGPYGGANVGPEPGFEVGATMPVIAEPIGLGPSIGDVGLDDETISDDLHCDDLNLDGTIQVSGDVTILCEGDFTLSTHADVVLGAGATLALYVRGEAVFMPHSTFNSPPDTGMPANAWIYILGTEEIRTAQPNAELYATVLAPYATMRVMPNSSFFGSFIGKALDIKANAGFHLDTNITVPLDACGVPIADVAGAPLTASDGAITSQVTFEQWYTDVLGVNLSQIHDIRLSLDPFGVYEYADDAFYPVDDRLFGNEGDPHNYYFTYTIEAQFEYEQCAGQFLELAGADDIWVFVNDQLVIDLGGITPGTKQVIELDRLALADGETYGVHIFYAHRDPTSAGFGLRTNIELWTNEICATASIPCD